MDIYTTLADPNANETALWYPVYGDLDHYKKIKVQNMNSTRRSFNTILENLVSPLDTLVLRTRYNYHYAPPADITSDKPKIQHIFYDNKWYVINAVDDKQLGNYGYIKAYEYYLSLTEVNYGRDFAKSGD